VEKIRLLVMISSYGLGGYETKMRNIVENLDKQLFDVKVVLLFPEYKAKSISKEARSLYFEYLSWKDVQREVIPLRTPVDLRAFRRLIRIIKNNEITGMFYFALGIGTFYAARAALRCRVSFTVRANDINRKGLYPKLFLSLDRYFLNRTDRIIVPSKFLKENMIREYRFDSEKVDVIPNGINLDRFSGSKDSKSLRKSLNLDLKTNVIGIIANLTPVKSHDVLIRAIPEIVNTSPDTVFLLVGDGPLQKPIEDLAKQLHVSQFIKFLGYQTQVEEIIALFDIGLLCSQIEIHPVSLIEIMASGTPVVAPCVGGIPEIVSHGEHGYLFPAGDSHALADAILILLNDLKQAKKFGKQAETFVRKEFSQEIMVKRFQNTLLRVAQKENR
jgi:glycosyltransferase involved in cell wall biosynthesis